MRSNRGSKDCDGSTYDKELQTIKQCINRAEHSLNNTKNFNLDLFKTLLSKEANKMSKSKQTFCLDKSTKAERKIGKKKHKIENDVMKQIDDLWDNNRRVYCTLVFRHTRKKHSWFKGTLSSESHLHQMEIQCYQCFIRQNDF